MAVADQAGRNCRTASRFGARRVAKTLFGSWTSAFRSRGHFDRDGGDLPGRTILAPSNTVHVVRAVYRGKPRHRPASRSTLAYHMEPTAGPRSTRLAQSNPCRWPFGRTGAVPSRTPGSTTIGLSRGRSHQGSVALNLKHLRCNVRVLIDHSVASCTTFMQNPALRRKPEPSTSSDRGYDADFRAFKVAPAGRHRR